MEYDTAPADATAVSAALDLGYSNIKSGIRSFPTAAQRTENKGFGHLRERQFALNTDTAVKSKCFDVVQPDIAQGAVAGAPTALHDASSGARGCQYYFQLRAHHPTESGIRPTREYAAKNVSKSCCRCVYATIGVIALQPQVLHSP